ncbi:MAG: exopolyphosphatase [Bacteroidota bacterium]
MKLAVIDLGTNTFHLLIVDLKERDFSVIFKEKTAVKLGKGGISEGLITEAAQKRALKALKRFKEVIDVHEVEQVSATATSAIRNAKNGQKLVEMIAQQTGIKTRVIDGLQEATYIYNGVKKALDIGPKPALIMDIGGGSIEFIIGNREQIFWKRSFEIGGQRLIDSYHKNDPISIDETAALNTYLSQELITLKEITQQYEIDSLIGSSGTFDTLSDIYRVKNGIDKDPEATELPLDFDEFHDIVSDLIAKDKSERLQIPGMIQLRVDMIVVAVILVKHVTDMLDIKNIRVSSYALKEGVLLDTIDSIKSRTLK